MLALLVVWHFAVRLQANPLLPGPLAGAGGLWELAVSGLLLRHVVASLFRVTWGFLIVDARNAGNRFQ